MANDVAARDATAEEWASRLAGADVSQLAGAIAAAEARGRRKGRDDLRGAVDHFEVAYRYAVNASRPGADQQDLLASAETFARIAYDQLRKVIEMSN